MQDNTQIPRPEQASQNTVSVIQHSINKNGDTLITYEIETYRYIWAEVLTHKMLSKNAQSSRAIPVASVMGINENNPVEPIEYGKNKSGMSSVDVLQGEELQKVRSIWLSAAESAFNYSKQLNEAGLHKQWSNRLTEPFSRIKVIITGSDTGWDNFEWLRDDPNAAQPEIVDLARKIKEAKSMSVPMVLFPGEAHVPYVQRYRGSGFRDDTFPIRYYSGVDEISLEDALKISASCCGQVSYRRLDQSYDKALDIYGKLFSGSKPHYSPSEHQGIAMKCTKASFMQRLFPRLMQKGVSHMDRNGDLWSANFKGFVQYRKLLELEHNFK